MDKPVRVGPSLCRMTMGQRQQCLQQFTGLGRLSVTKTACTILTWLQVHSGLLFKANQSKHILHKISASKKSNLHSPCSPSLRSQYLTAPYTQLFGRLELPDAHRSHRWLLVANCLHPFAPANPGVWVPKSVPKSRGKKTWHRSSKSENKGNWWSFTRPCLVVTRLLEEMITLKFTILDDFQLSAITPTLQITKISVEPQPLLLLLLLLQTLAVNPHLSLLPGHLHPCSSRWWCSSSCHPAISTKHSCST